jgi:CDP-diacylglycerol--glycerol-3-phosphate 3-phosphatidyltransferase
VSVATQNQPPAKDEPQSRVFNIPNQLTTARLVLAIVLFVLMSWKLFASSLVVFLIAAGTDWMDGYYARRYGQVTVLGRILDPFVDKIIICGAFIFLAAVPQESGDSQVRAWMAVVVVGRELLVTALRSFLEQQGADFSASWSGKLKMVLQCGAVALSLYHLSDLSAEIPSPPWLDATLPAVVWAAILMTVYSGVAYVIAAIRLLRPEAGG